MESWLWSLVCPPCLSFLSARCLTEPYPGRIGSSAPKSCQAGCILSGGGCNWWTPKKKLLLRIETDQPNFSIILHAVSSGLHQHAARTCAPCLQVNTGLIDGDWGMMKSKARSSITRKKTTNFGPRFWVSKSFFFCRVVVDFVGGGPQSSVGKELSVDVGANLY